MLLVAFLCLTWQGCVLLYLSHKNQALFAQPLSDRVWLWIALGTWAAGLLCAWFSLTPMAAIFAWSVALMLGLALVPFISLVRKPGKRQSA